MTEREFVLARDQYEEYTKTLRYMYAHFGGHFTNVDYWDDPGHVHRPSLWCAIYNVIKHWWYWHRVLKHELAEGKRILEEENNG